MISGREDAINGKGKEALSCSPPEITKLLGDL
jgi:hypothetical protein